MKIVGSILAMSILMSNLGFANAQPVLDEEVFTTNGDEEIFTADDSDFEMPLEEGEERIAVLPLIALIVGLTSLGCAAAENEGEALARRDRGARKTYNNNRWKIRAGVAAGGGPAALVVLRCFEAGLNG